MTKLTKDNSVTLIGVGASPLINVTGFSATKIQSTGWSQLPALQMVSTWKGIKFRILQNPVLPNVAYKYGELKIKQYQVSGLQISLGSKLRRGLGQSRLLVDPKDEDPQDGRLSSNYWNKRLRKHTPRQAWGPAWGSGNKQPSTFGFHHFLSIDESSSLGWAQRL